MTQRFFTTPSILYTITLTATVTLNLWANSALAGDPFRSTGPHQIGPQTEAAFRDIFEQGNYPLAERDLKQALSSEPNEPLAYAMDASLAYSNKDWHKLDIYSQKTLETGQNLIARDPLRGNLYTAVGHFLVGATTLTREGTVNGVPAALSELQQVYEYLDKAEGISATDPELNLIKGYMDLLLAVNLPFADPDQAIEKLKQNAAPKYLVDRGIALAYRDLKQYPQALDYVNNAIQETPNNPEIYYLKAQILNEKGKREKNQALIQEAIADFDKTLSKKSQLPSSLVQQIEHERSQAANFRF